MQYLPEIMYETGPAFKALMYDIEVCMKASEHGNGSICMSDGRKCMGTAL